MTTAISVSLADFTEAINDPKKNVVTHRSGSWEVLSGVKKILTHFTWYQRQRVEKVSKSFNKVLDQLEKVPVQFNTTDNQSDTLEEHLEAAKAIKAQLKKYAGSKSVSRQLVALKRRTVALRYRMEGVNGGLDAKEAVTETVEKLESSLENWKKNYELYQDKTLSDRDKELLNEAARHPKFVKLLLLDRGVRNQFFRWVIRDNNNIDSFVQFPSTCNRLKSALLSGRIGLFANTYKTVQNVGGEKVFTLPFYTGGKTEEISILDESRVVELDVDDSRTIKKVFDVFAKKNLRAGDLEFIGTQGISKWDLLEWGKAEYMEVENSRWWENLPPHETLNLETVKARYGIRDIADGQWITVAKSTRESCSLDVGRSHGYLEMLIPDGTGDYRVYPFGKFAKEFPTGVLEQFLFVTHTVESAIEYPDENTFYSHRQKAGAPFVIDEEKGLEYMEMIRKDVVESVNGNVVFQFGWENCAWWPQKRLEELLGKKGEGEGQVPNLFAAHMLDSRPKAPILAFIFTACRILPKCLKQIATRVTAFIMGSWRGMWIKVEGKRVFKSMFRSKFTDECQTNLPAMLHERIQNGEINGTVTLGHQFALQNV